MEEGRKGKREEEKKTYADRVKEGQSAPRGRTLIIKGKDGESPEAVKAKVLQTVSPVEEGVKVRGVWKGKSGVLLNVADDDSWQTVKGHQGLKDKGLTIQEPERRMPRMAIYGMDRKIEKDSLVSLVYEQNFKGLCEEKLFKEGFISLYRTGRRDLEKGAWVVRVSPGVRTKLMEVWRVYIGWDSCRLEDEAGVVRCFRCQAYGHLAGKCKAAKVCGHCADRKECPRKAEGSVCIKCRRVGCEAGHSVTSDTCPCYVRQLSVVARITEYGS